MVGSIPGYLTEFEILRFVRLVPFLGGKSCYSVSSSSAFLGSSEAVSRKFRELEIAGSIPVYPTKFLVFMG